MHIRPFHPSFQTLARAFKGIRKVFAINLNLSPSSVDKMMEEPRNDVNPDGSGQRNFLDEFHIACYSLRETDRPGAAHDLGRWAAHVADGFFTPHREFSGFLPADACGLINDLLKNTNATTEQIRKSVFTSSGKRTFTKEERAELYRTFEEGMGVYLAAREYVRTHKAEE